MRQAVRTPSQANGESSGQDRSSRRAFSGLPSRNYRPTGSLAYLQAKSLYLYTPSFQVPLPRVPLAPKLCAYPFNRDAICGQPSQDPAASQTEKNHTNLHLTRNQTSSSTPFSEGLGEETGANVFDVAASLQLLQEFDVAGILPNLINPKGYPNLLALPPPLPAGGQGTPGVRTAGHSGSRPSSAGGSQSPSTSVSFQHLPAEDLAIVANVLPELALQRVQNALLNKRDGEEGNALKGEKRKPQEERGASPRVDKEGDFDAAAGVYRHPTQPHLRPKRIFTVVPDRRLCGNDYLPVGIDLPADEAEGAHPERDASRGCPDGSEAFAAELTSSLSEHAGRDMPPAVLVVSEATGTSVSYAYYTRLPEGAEKSGLQFKREENEAASDAETVHAKYRFARFYSSHMLTKNAAAPAENSFLLIIPNASPASPTKQSSLPREEFAYVVPLHSQRRILVKAGGSARRPRLSVLARAPTKEEEENTEARREAACGRAPGKKRGGDFSGDEEAFASEASLHEGEASGREDGSDDARAESESGRKRRRQSPPEASGHEGEDADTGSDALFANDEEEEKDVSSSSASSSSESSSSGSEDEGEDDSSDSSNEEDEE
uniref:RNA polymerase II associated Paf1 complex component PAF1 n=1 Tax=Neospora caninum (strain Liverpool) TaxID=572307 RepID=F0JB31_NEOCL|nr:hypothetical protein, conserved [Neospora caninum Liverpool]CEL71297.1 TPA: hypothetical protein, conserved [Neospora caninum Liverpool]